MDESNELREAFEEVLRDRGINPEFQFLHCPPTRQGLIDALGLVDEARSQLLMIGYEAWAKMLDPVVDLVDAEADEYPNEEEVTA